MINKIQTYLGFCIRAGKLVYGTDNIEKQKKGVKLIVCDKALAENALGKMGRESKRFSCPLLLTPKNTLGALLHRPAVKAVGIKDEHLAAAIKTAAEHEPTLEFYSGGNE